MNSKSKIKLSAFIIIFALGSILVLIYANSFDAQKSTYHNNFYILTPIEFRKGNWQIGDSEKLSWHHQNAKAKAGKLILTIKNNGDKFTGGELFTKESFGFGKYEARMIPIKNPGVVTGFFNYANENGIGTEIDIEFLGYDTTKVQFNYYTDSVGGHEFLYDLGFDAAEDYHTYGFDWTSDGIYWYVDGEMVYEAHTDIPVVEGPIFMSACPSEDVNWAGKYDGKAPLSAYFDWISYTRQ